MKKKLMYLLLVTIFILIGCTANEGMRDNNTYVETIDDSYNEQEADANKTKDYESESIADTNETKVSGNETKDEVNDLNVIEQLTPEPGDDLNTELEEVEEKSDELKAKLQSDITQMELNQTASDWYTLWDDELNSLWNRISETVDADTKNTLLKEQRAWIKEKERTVEEASAIYEGGSIQPLIEYKKAAQLTRARCYVLAAYLGKAIGQEVEPLNVEYPGRYVDTQGTMEDYSNLYVTEEADGTYVVQLGIYRITTFEGTAKLENGILKFTDEFDHIKADIMVYDESATVKVTESNWGYIETGEIFEFPEKWE